MKESIARMPPRTQGYIDVGPGRVWYESTGVGDLTLLLLHGGPGGNSEDLSPFLELADFGFRVVRYDQLGSWRSDQPDDITLWQAARFVDEVEQVRQALELGQVHLLGQSWGAFLAIDYALHHGNHLRSLILASGAASTRECVAGMNTWRRALPPETQATLAHYEAAENYSHPEYLAAMETLYQRHFCRVSPYPAPLAEAIKHVATPVYTTMWGPNEFTCTGNLLDWDRTDRLHEIAAPTLITAGEFDEVHPSCARTLHSGIQRSWLEIFDNCGHHAELEDPERYRTVLLNFLDYVDSPEVRKSTLR
jgi:proline iminopeptidase